MRNKIIRMLSSATSAAVLVALVGCETGTSDERSEGRAIDDTHISEHVQKALENEPTYKFTDVKVSTFAGIVQLSGFVNVNGQRERAQQIAQQTDGVREVQNGIALKPMPMPVATSRINSESQVYAQPQQQAPAAQQPADGSNQNLPPKQQQ
jgi:hypothetical protein